MDEKQLQAHPLCRSQSIRAISAENQRQAVPEICHLLRGIGGGMSFKLVATGNVITQTKISFMIYSSNE